MRGIPRSIMPIDFASRLNEEQLRAVEAPDGPVLIIAAAGTGKTRTLTHRVAYLVEKGVDSGRILLLTFTNKAAREMLERAQELVGTSVGGLWGGTFHHMANRMLRRHADQLGFGLDYTILDQDDARSLMRACEQDLDLLGKHFPKPDVLLGIFSYAANTETDPADMAREYFKLHDVNIDDVMRVHDEYVKRKRNMNAMDFDDLLVQALQLYREHPDILARYQDQFKYIMVDEYQDTNAIQSEWIDVLAQGHRNLMVVGDDFQSIYSWRGADFRNIMTFPDRYEDARIFKLETNYRSTPQILDVANACIRSNPEQFQKTLRPVREASPPPEFMICRDGFSQAQYVIGWIREYLSQGVKPSEIAILYRAHFHAMELEFALARERMAYSITSGVRFFEQLHIKDVCSIVRMVDNPCDVLSFARLFEMLPGVGRKTIAKVWGVLGDRFQVRDADKRALILKSLPKKSQEDASVILEILADYAEKRMDQDPAALLQEFLDRYYDAYAIESFDNYARRVDDIQELIKYSVQFGTVEQFLSEMALLSNIDAETVDVSGGDSQAVRLSTIHQAKGLEWKVVFVLWMADGMFPSSRSLEEVGGEAEERRLFYVAMTRAEDSLHLCLPTMRKARDGSVQYCTPSRFLGEIPTDLLSGRRETSRY